MHKIDGAGHLGNMFVAEDPLLNRAPTEITAEWLNAVQIELANVIQWAGLNLSKVDNGQLLQALQSKFASLDPGGDFAVKSAVQFDDFKVADADVVGGPDALVAAFFPAITALAQSHGMVLYVRALAANATATPTFTPNNGTIAAKTIVKGNNLPLVAGDIAGAGFWAELRYDLTLDKWVLLNPATGITALSTEVGFIKPYAGATPPVGYLAVPVAKTEILIASYAELAAVCGTTWGVAVDPAKFVMPWLPAGYTWLQGGAVGSQTTGENKAHQHNEHSYAGAEAMGNAGYGYAVSGWNGAVTGTLTSLSGGAANLAAGHYAKFCVKY